MYRLQWHCSNTSFPASEENMQVTKLLEELVFRVYDFTCLGAKYVGH